MPPVHTVSRPLCKLWVVGHAYTSCLFRVSACDGSASYWTVATGPHCGALLHVSEVTTVCKTVGK